jgi:diaminohydroxyphosphoribosylaminopyrimidine deaminase/5-amino-6-(5-phosphoribosylamino)uracil reductase
MMQDEQFMRRAIQLAYRGSGSVSPNPLVGAVLVHNNRIIGEGWHAVYGDVHAEVMCLDSVADEDKRLIPQSTIYVTLEPCAHQGKQPPCSLRLIREGLKRVVIAVEDPFPQVSGRGISQLQEKGIEVTVGVCAEEARWMCRRFLTVQEKGRPYVILKWAQSVDGFFAPADRSRHQLSNSYSQALVHKWRTEEAAIMVGYNTALTDNPQLTARLWQGKQPLRIVLDRNLRLPSRHALFDGSAETWIVNEQVEQTGANISYVQMPFSEHLLINLVKRLADSGKASLFVEGGVQLLNSFIQAGLWDEARVFTAHQLLNAGLAAPQLSAAKRVFSTSVGSDELNCYESAQSTFSYPTGAII